MQLQAKIGIVIAMGFLNLCITCDANAGVIEAEFKKRVDDACGRTTQSSKARNVLQSVDLGFAAAQRCTVAMALAENLLKHPLIDSTVTLLPVVTFHLDIKSALRRLALAGASESETKTYQKLAEAIDRFLIGHEHYFAPINKFISSSLQPPAQGISRSLVYLLGEDREGRVLQITGWLERRSETTNPGLRFEKVVHDSLRPPYTGETITILATAMGQGRLNVKVQGSRSGDLAGRGLVVDDPQAIVWLTLLYRSMGVSEILFQIDEEATASLLPGAGPCAGRSIDLLDQPKILRGSHSIRSEPREASTSVGLAVDGQLAYPALTISSGKLKPSENSGFSCVSLPTSKKIGWIRTSRLKRN